MHHQRKVNKKNNNKQSTYLPYIYTIYGDTRLGNLTKPQR